MRDGGQEGFINEWNNARNPLKGWIQRVYSAYMESGLTFLDAAELVGATVAEFEAVTRLALLDDADLELVSKVNPPMTTWILLSELSSEHLRTVFSLVGPSEGETSSYEQIRAAIRKMTGEKDIGVVQNLDYKLFEFAHKKALAYKLWAEKSKNYGALKSFARRRKSEQSLTPRQVTYAAGLLRELVESGAIKVPSPDGDDELCNQIIEVVS